MPATTFPEYAREIEDVLNAVVAMGEATLVNIFRYDNAAHRPRLPQAEHKHTPASAEVSHAPTLAQVVDEILKGARL